MEIQSCLISTSLKYINSSFTIIIHFKNAVTYMTELQIP
jgi:hypothetical protein